MLKSLNLISHQYAQKYHILLYSAIYAMNQEISAVALLL
jgi:hypothetical protein